MQRIHWDINKNDFWVVIGDNGSGKTTLIQGLLGLKKPHSGTITYQLPCTDIGYLPQKNSIQSTFPASIWEVVSSGHTNKLTTRPFFNKQEKQKTIDCLKQLNIYDIRHKSFQQLSGGQQQRVLLARALLASSQLLVLDEPLTGLDTTIANELMEELKLLHQNNYTIVMISHHIEQALNVATHVIDTSKEKHFIGTIDDYRGTL